MSPKIFSTLCLGMHLVVENDAIYFIAGIGGTVARNYYFAGIAIKLTAHYFRLDFVNAIE